MNRAVRLNAEPGECELEDRRVRLLGAGVGRCEDDRESVGNFQACQVFMQADVPVRYARKRQTARPEPFERLAGPVQSG